MLRASEPESKPFPHMGQLEMPQSYRELSDLGFWSGAALSQIPVTDRDLEESAYPQK